MPDIRTPTIGAVALAFALAALVGRGIKPFA